MADTSNRSIHCDIAIEGQQSIAAKTKALIDTGAAGEFISTDFAKRHNIPLTPLLIPMPVYNVDKSLNTSGKITHYAKTNIEIQGIKIPSRLYASNIGNEDIILGFP